MQTEENYYIYTQINRLILSKSLIAHWRQWHCSLLDLFFFAQMSAVLCSNLHLKSSWCVLIVVQSWLVSYIFLRGSFLNIKWKLLIKILIFQNGATQTALEIFKSSRCLKITGKVSMNIRVKRATFTFRSDKSSLKMPKMVC